jgi:HlyD family secretion protein
MKNNKLLIIAGIATVIIIIALVIGKKQGWIGKSDATEVSIEKVTKRTIVETVAASGKVQPEAEVKISPDVPGEIIELTVKEGDKVTAGQLLVRIDPDIQQSNVERLEAAMNTTKANLANAKSRKAQVDAQFTNAKTLYERNKKLFEQKVISEQEMDAATSSYEVAKNEVEAAKQNVSGADFNVEKCKCRFAGSKEKFNPAPLFFHRLTERFQNFRWRKVSVLWVLRKWQELRL